MSGDGQLAVAATESSNLDMTNDLSVHDEDDSDSWETITESDKSQDLTPISAEDTTLIKAPLQDKTEIHNDISTLDNRTIWRLFESTKKSANFHITQYLRYQIICRQIKSPDTRSRDAKKCNKSKLGMIRP
jgi:hypothetical protein